MNAYQRACHGKARFPSRRAARRRRRQIHGQGGPLFDIYRCTFCRALHVGHKPGYATHLRPGPHGPIPVTEYPA